MKPSKLHRLLGLFLLLPLFIWATTGAFFIIKPGYKAAYEKITITAYPLLKNIELQEPQRWLESRQIRSILGHHLLVRDEKGWQQLSAETQQPLQQPSNTALKALFSDAIQHNRARYGEITSVDALEARTSTDINLTLDWNTLNLQQFGKDRALISQLYKIHYLEWAGNPLIDGLLEILGLGGLILLSGLGLWLSLKKDQQT